MVAGVRDLDRCGMPRTAVAAHAPRGYPPLRPSRLRPDPPYPRSTARPGARPGEPRLHFRWGLRSWLARLRDPLPAIQLWSPAPGGHALRCARVALPLGTDRADDLQWLPGLPLPGRLPKYDLRSCISRLCLVGTACLHAVDL